ncbi:MAG TPA: Bax inhibitor-1/YccA family protein [Bacteroidales bacterium]|nr:Bax inhibitor-1/YccA family protein [Bacteroidales bacterium]
MNIGRSANPALNKKTFANAPSLAGEEVMTVQGTVNKIFLMLLLVLAGAIYTWKIVFGAVDLQTGSQQVTIWLAVGGIGGFIAALVTIFKKSFAPYSGPVYAVLEGLLLGGLSAMLEAQFPGVVVQAVALTFGTLFTLLFLYKSGLIKVTQKFKIGIIAATGGIFLVYLISFILQLFGVHVGFMYNNSAISIGFSIIVVIIAALNLVLDFDFIEQGAAAGAPKYMEWYAAFGLMVTLIWLYIEILRLLSKIASRR